jgi:integrase
MATIWKRKDRDVWVVDFRDATGKRQRKIAGPSRESAEHLLAQVIQSAKETPADVRDRDITVRDYGTRWLAQAQHDLALRTHRSYQQLFERHIAPALGHLKVRDLRRREVRHLLTKKREAGLGKNSLRLIKATLSTMLAQAVEDELLQANPALGRFRGTRRAGPTVADVNPMSEEQTQIFLQVVSRLEAEHRLTPTQAMIFALLSGTGMRPSEARALSVDDVDIRRKALRVERAADLHNQVKATKTVEARVVDLSERLCQRLQAYLSWLTLEAMAHGLGHPTALFPGEANGLLDESQLRKVFKWVLRQADLPGFRVYDLRHSYASRLLSAGVPLLYVSKQLGHAKPTTTLKHYAKYIPSEDRRYVDTLDQESEKVGTKGWHQVDVIEEKDSEVVEEFGGPCRGRTYGPLIKSQLLYQLS